MPRPGRVLSEAGRTIVQRRLKRLTGVCAVRRKRGVLFHSRSGEGGHEEAVDGRPRRAARRRGRGRRGREPPAAARLRGVRHSGVVSPKEGASAQENISNRIVGLQVLAHEMVVAGLNRSMVDGIANARGKAGEAGAVSASEVRENLTVAQVEDTRFLSISYTSGDRKQAQAVANTAARVFVERAPAASGMATDASVGVSAYAPPPQALEGPNPARSGVLAAVLGLMGGVGPRLPAGALLGRLGLAGGGRAGLGRAQFRRRSGVRPGKEQEGRIRGVGSIRHEFGRVGRAPRQRS
jgi:hypothetical protein